MCFESRFHTKTHAELPIFFSSTRANGYAFFYPHFLFRLVKHEMVSSRDEAHKLCWQLLELGNNSHTFLFVLVISASCFIMFEVIDYHIAVVI